jgi:hypothetical protein
MGAGYRLTTSPQKTLLVQEPTNTAGVFKIDENGQK